MEKLIVLEGICHLYDENSLCQVFWDSKYIFPPSSGWPYGRFDFKGLWTLKDGDHLTIFDKKTGKKVVWSGFISLWTDKMGHIHQIDISKKRWAKWFGKEYPAKFTPGPNQTKKSS